MTDLDTVARALYERNTNGSAPPWENLGEITKGVWREEVERRAALVPHKIQSCRVDPIDYENSQPCACADGTCALWRGGLKPIHAT